jgi:hypothetical protein
MIPGRGHCEWPTRAAGRDHYVKQEAVAIAQPRDDRGCPPAQSIADIQKSAIPKFGKRQTVSIQVFVNYPKLQELGLFPFAF